MQQAAQDGLAAPEGHMPRLAAGHLLDWCDGTSSAVQVQQHMANAVADDFEHPMVKRLARIGTAQNANRGLLNLLGKTCGIDSLITSLPGNAVSHMVLPSTWASLMAREFPREFRLHFGADEHKLKQFWGEFLSRPRTRDFAGRHPFLKGKRANDLVNTLPCSLHSDAGPFSKKLSCNCVSFGSLLSEGQENVTGFLVHTNVKEKARWRRSRVEHCAEGLRRLGRWRATCAKDY